MIDKIEKNQLVSENSSKNNTQRLRESALYYHRFPKPGKIAVTPTKQLTNQYDLSMAYSPGVAAACEEIVAKPEEVATLTSRANLVGVITNGTAGARPWQYRSAGGEVSSV